MKTDIRTNQDEIQLAVFRVAGDKYALDVLYEETDAFTVQCELDTYWIRKGGEDPTRHGQALPKLRGRVKRP